MKKILLRNSTFANSEQDFIGTQFTKWSITVV